MKTVKIISYIVGAVVVLLALFVSYINFTLPDVPLIENVTIPTDSVRVANGKYLANSVAVCMDCHSSRDWTKFSGPMITESAGQGGERFDQQFGFPGKFFSKNITPAELKNWTDAEILRAVSSGVTKDNKALFPVMPYLSYNHVDENDLLDIIAYVRTVKPIENKVEASVPDFPMSLIMKTIPKKAEFVTKPSVDNKNEYGKYLVTLGACAECHTKQEDGKPIPGMDFAGGFEFKVPTGGTAISANITPDKETGLGKWTEDDFVTRFKKYSAESGYVPVTVQTNTFNTVMPWSMYSNMKTDDLKAIYTYLQSIKPVENKVDHFKAY